MPCRRLFLFALLVAACARNQGAVAVAPPAPTPAPAAASAGDVPSQLGNYRLTGVEAIKGFPSDTIFRFTDGSAATVSAIRFPVPEDVKEGTDPQAWLTREAAKFAQVQ